MFSYLRIAAVAATIPFMLSTGARSDAGDDTLRVAFGEEVLNLDYNNTTKREYIILSDLVDEGLFDYDPEANTYVPSVATGYEYLDPLTIEVKLRDGITFHDGSALTAEDVAYTYNWIISEGSESKAKSAIERWLDKAVVVDSKTIRFDMLEEYPLAVRDMANRIQIRKAGTYDDDPNAAAIDLVGLGPYQVVSFEPGKEVVLKAYDGYFADSPKQPVQIGNIVIRSLPDSGTQQAELFSGGVDWIFKVSRDVAESMGAAPNIDHVVSTDLRIGFLVLDAFGHTDPEGPLTNVLVRRAMNHAINRKEIAEFLMGGGAQVVHTACHPAQFGCDQSVADYAYDPEKARALLAEAGYPDGFDLELWSYRDKSVAEVVVAKLEAVGITVSLRHGKLASLNEARANRQIQAYFGTWGSGGTPDTAAIARVHFSADSDRNMSNNPKVTDLVLAAEVTGDQEKRDALYSEALSIIADEAYWVPMFSYAQNFLVSSELEFPTYADGLPRLYRAKWK
ncbi:ABC transporter substrate-binding protein [Roseibium sp.]|uniref:ABC transporter substrate-binding protein n=2 Tax=Roseibium sp. TaxID=1936156 RepID=UPI003265A1AC